MKREDIARVIGQAELAGAPCHAGQGADALNAAALFTGEGVLLHAASAPGLDDLDSIICTRPVCHVLFDARDPGAFERNDVDLIYLLPMVAGPHQLASEHHAAIVATLDQGGRTGLHGTHDEAVYEAVEAVLALLGGGHA